MHARLTAIACQCLPLGLLPAAYQRGWRIIDIITVSIQSKLYELSTGLPRLAQSEQIAPE